MIGVLSSCRHPYAIVAGKGGKRMEDEHRGSSGFARWH